MQSFESRSRSRKGSIDADAAAWLERYNIPVAVDQDTPPRADRIAFLEPRSVFWDLPILGSIWSVLVESFESIPVVPIHTLIVGGLRLEVCLLMHLLLVRLCNLFHHLLELVLQRLYFLGTRLSSASRLAGRSLNQLQLPFKCRQLPFKRRSLGLALPCLLYCLGLFHLGCSPPRVRRLKLELDSPHLTLSLSHRFERHHRLLLLSSNSHRQRADLVPQLLCLFSRNTLGLARLGRSGLGRCLGLQCSLSGCS